MSADGDAQTGIAATGGAPDWRAFFNRFARVVLIGNSHEADPAALGRQFGDDTLFVFFNRVYKVLDAPFAGRRMLVARATDRGAIIVRSNVVDLVHPLMAGAGFEGVINLKGETMDRFDEPSAFRLGPVWPLDLSTVGQGLYPAGKVPSTGFAFLLWLLDLGLETRVALHCFTGERSPNWRNSRAHDWTFEQVALRFLLRSGRIDALDDHLTGDMWTDRIVARFGGDRNAVAARAAEGLLRRVDVADRPAGEAWATQGPVRFPRQTPRLFGKRFSERFSVARRTGK